MVSDDSLRCFTESLYYLDKVVPLADKCDLTLLDEVIRLVGNLHLNENRETTSFLEISTSLMRFSIPKAKDENIEEANMAKVLGILAQLL